MAQSDDHNDFGPRELREMLRGVKPKRRWLKLVWAVLIVLALIVFFVWTILRERGFL